MPRIVCVLLFVFCLFLSGSFAATLPSSYIEDGSQGKNQGNEGQSVSKSNAQSNSNANDAKQTPSKVNPAKTDQNAKSQTQSPNTSSAKADPGAGGKSLPAPQQIKPAYQITAGNLIIEMSPVITTPVHSDHLTLTMLIKNEGTSPTSILFYGAPTLIDENGKKHTKREWIGAESDWRPFHDATHRKLLAPTSSTVVYPGAPIKVVSQYYSDIDKSRGHEFSFTVGLGVAIDRSVKAYTLSAPSLPLVIR